MSKTQSRILNVDDNDGARYVKSRVLTLAGYTVSEAACGRDALSKARTEQPDLILLDVKLPDINGLEVCRRLKEDPATRAILVLQTSASLIDSANRVKALDAGADSYLAEPIEPEELVANVKALLRLKRAEEASRHAETALRESEERFRQLAESITDIFWVVSTHDRRFLYVSPAYTQHWGRREQSLYADPALWFADMSTQDRERLQQRFAQLGSGGQGYEEEYRTLGAQGDERWVAERAFPIYDAAGQAYRFAGITQDITDRKRAELLLLKADQHKDEFLAMLAHELRNPLAPIKNAVSILSQLHPPEAHPKVAAGQAVHIIDRQIDHLTRLVEDLLDVSRINQGKISMDLQAVELKAVLTTAIETVHPLLKAHEHLLTVNLPPAPIWVEGDAVRLSQVFSNLLNNAAKFTAPHGRIGIEARMGGGGQVEVSVVDNGAGITRDVLPRVFDLFIQGDQALDRSQGGLGIGLSLVKRIVDLHGGHVHAESDGPYRGSRFTVSLPVIAAPASTCHPDHAPAPSEGLRILVVDDNADSVESLSMLLESYGHVLHTASHGEMALRQAQAHPLDLVVLDIGLPGMNGYDVARAIRALPLSRQPVLVALSGYGRDNDRRQAKESGFDHHLVKPADPEQLFEIMSTISTGHDIHPA